MNDVSHIEIQRFNVRGVNEVRLAIEGLRSQGNAGKGSQGSPIAAEQIEALRALSLRDDLIESAGYGTIDTGLLFPNRFVMSEYLAHLIGDAKAEGDDGLWTWISMVYISQLLAPRKDGALLLASEYRYIPDNNRLRYYRHLVRMGWTIFRQYGSKARLFLSVPCFTHSDFVEQSQKDDVQSNPHLIDLCLELFYDEESKKLKKGVASSERTPGSFRRLVSVVSPQLYMNYDLYEMPSSRIRGVLPKEFQRWMLG